ncbi:putative mitochondrial protein [Andalucia godoyi]|uniref:Putative mitochondrial protein n=1 Tax=Andalucia godoyi TaxID=505711 RepID=A0A8K0F4E4_ANDGO|nr:putative mitochondrial protein [Andalucia godoyi]|eukprot:ANDGO_07081.mRNA.1 putative mitochondrial protein
MSTSVRSSRPLSATTSATGASGAPRIGVPKPVSSSVLQPVQTLSYQELKKRDEKLRETVDSLTCELSALKSSHDQLKTEAQVEKKNIEIRMQNLERELLEAQEQLIETSQKAVDLEERMQSSYEKMMLNGINPSSCTYFPQDALDASHMSIVEEKEALEHQLSALEERVRLRRERASDLLSGAQRMVHTLDSRILI